MSGTTKADVVVRRARADDVPAIVDLLRAGLGEGTLARSPEVWRWKHEQNPFGASPVLVAEADQRLIALRAFMRWRWSDDDGGIAAVRAVDTVTHPDHQGQGAAGAGGREPGGRPPMDGADWGGRGSVVVRASDMEGWAKGGTVRNERGGARSALYR